MLPLLRHALLILTALAFPASLLAQSPDAPASPDIVRDILADRLGAGAGASSMPSPEQQAEALAYFLDNCAQDPHRRTSAALHRIDPGDGCAWRITTETVTTQYNYATYKTERFVRVNELRFHLGHFVPDAQRNRSIPGGVLIRCDRSNCVTRRTGNGTVWRDQAPQEATTFSCSPSSIAPNAASALDILVRSCIASAPPLERPRFPAKW